jgi:nucleoside-diphosphate-sugar epimerase
MNREKLLITGSSGFIGKALCEHLHSLNQVIGLDLKENSAGLTNIIYKTSDLSNQDLVRSICDNNRPDIVIHCAGIAHQKAGTVDKASYMRVNSEVTESLAKAACAANPDVHFIFFSTISVYGEDHPVQPVAEGAACTPSSDYAISKLDAEKRLIKLYEQGHLRNLTILRLAPVYDREWSFNLQRRVLSPKKIVFLRFGTGRQKMSALARPNLVEFIEHLLKKSSKDIGMGIMNVCDAEPYEFNNIIKIFKRSGLFQFRPVIKIPLPIVWLGIRVAGFFSGKKNWVNSWYNKLAFDLVFDISKMLQSGFKPQHTLKSIFIRKV